MLDKIEDVLKGADYEYLLSCYSCGDGDVCRIHVAVGRYRYRCRGCGCLGAPGNTSKEAQQKWNTRYTSPEIKSLIDLGMRSLTRIGVTSLGYDCIDRDRFAQAIRNHKGKFKGGYNG